MSTRRIRVAWVLGLGLLSLVAACPEGGKPPTLEPDHGAAPAGQALAISVEAAAELLVPMLGTYSCPDGGSASLSGDSSDADLDGIPGDARVTLDNCRTVNGSVTLNLAAGQIRLVDDDPAAANFKFTRTESGVTVDTTLPEASIEVVRNSTGTGSPEQSGYRVFYDYDTSIVSQLSTGERLEISANAGWSVLYQPSGAWTPGEPLVAGVMSVSGPWSVVVDGATATAIVGTVTPLSVDPGCGTAAHVTAGRIEASGDEVFGVTWTACGQADVDVNGETVAQVDSNGGTVAPTPTPTPTPTDSPTGSSTDSPSPSPSGSASGSPSGSPTAAL